MAAKENSSIGAPAEFYFQAAHSEHTILRVRLYRYQ
jgi:hypothetical protein